MGISLEDKVNCLPVTELRNLVLVFKCVLQNTQPPHGIRSATDPFSELEANSESNISVVISSVSSNELYILCLLEN